MDKESLSKVTHAVKKEIKELNIGVQFSFIDFLLKYNLSEEEMVKVSDELSKSLKDNISKIQGNESDLIYKIKFERIDIKKEFDKLPYKFYLFNSFMRLRFKLSSKVFAVKTEDGIFIINDEEKTKTLWKKFLAFVKTAPKYVPLKNKNGVKTGVMIEEYWKNRFCQLFKKLPDNDSTIDFLVKLFKENGYEIKTKETFKIKK